MIAEVALAVVVLVGAGLLIRTFSALHNVPPGFDPHNVLTMETALTGTSFDRTAAIAALSRQAIERNWSNAAYTNGRGYPNSSGQNGCLDGGNFK